MMPVACDVNGDGRDEIVVSNHKDGVYCIGNIDGKSDDPVEIPISRVRPGRDRG